MNGRKRAGCASFIKSAPKRFGRSDPLIDAEILLLLNDFFSSLGLTEIAFQLNSLGDSDMPTGVS